MFVDLQPASAIAGGPWHPVTEAWTGGMHAMQEGWAFMTAPANRDVACLGLIKASGAMCWGITDLLNVKCVWFVQCACCPSCVENV